MVHPEVLKAYKDANYEYWERAEDKNEEVFFEKAKASQHEIEHQITQVFRLKVGTEEKMYYQEILRSKDYLNNPIDHNRTVGKYDLPVFIKRIDPNTGKALPTEVSEHKTVYELDFDKKRLDLEVKRGTINEKTNFVLITLGRRYGGFAYEEFANSTFQELYDLGKYGAIRPTFKDREKKQ